MSDMTTEPASHRDRSAALILFGVIEILIGAGAAILVPVGLIAASAMGLGSELRSTAPVAVLYETGAIALIVLGVGSIRARRWAREIWLSLSWIWLLTGVCSVAISWMMLPRLLADIGGTTGLTPQGLLMTSLGILVVLIALYVLLPGVILLFYRSPHVAATCLVRDPHPQSTDHLPQRLLTLTLLWFLLAVSVIVMPAYSWLFPFFGFIWTGAAGAAAWLVSALVFLALGLGTANQDARALWAAISVTAAAAASTIVTFGRIDLRDIVAAMNLPADQMAMAASLSQFNRTTMVIFWCVVWGPFLVYLWSLRSAFGLVEDRGD